VLEFSYVNQFACNVYTVSEAYGNRAPDGYLGALWAIVVTAIELLLREVVRSG
jgi:hypothetical protein